ncbi:MAG: ATP-dependent DNA helicase RecQ [Bacteroidales bacterium]
MEKEDDIHEILRRYWGYDSFRPLQEDIINSILEGRDTLGLMPTGGGKSITFQVPALVKDGICLVITPLISLMKDQVDNLRALDIKATHIHSGMTRREITIALENSTYGKYKFLYVSPERLSSELFIEKLRLMNISMIVVDEAHCISQWGYDFRPAYIHIAEVRKLLPKAPILALTATATPEVVKDIQEKLLFKEKNLFLKSFARHNLAYVVRNTENKVAELIRIFNRVPGTAIVYVRNRKRTKEIAIELQKSGFTADYFHAGIASQEKTLKQQLWKNGACRIIVATNAFGMGIDKPDVRTVVHIDLPNSPEEYFQEAGRAGRDGKKAYAVLLYTPHDKAKLKKRVSDSFPEKEFIIKTYDAVCNYLQIAVGFGDGTVRDFNINEFCEIFKQPILQTFNAIKIIELSGYMEYVEDVNTMARMMITVDRNELYRWTPQNQTEETILECAMRSYSGLFTEYAFIQEDIIARRAGTVAEDVYAALVSMSKQCIIHYIPRKVTPYIYFTAPREETRHISIPKSVYEERRDRFTKRIESMIEYATHDKKCRQEMLLAYFGEISKNPCGMCDNCLKREDTNVNDLDFAEISHAIKELIATTPLPINVITESLSHNKEKVIEVLRFLTDEGYISYNETLYGIK